MRMACLAVLERSRAICRKQTTQESVELRLLKEGPATTSYRKHTAQHVHSHKKARSTLTLVISATSI
jgi:hypothetical protein